MERRHFADGTTTRFESGEVSCLVTIAYTKCTRVYIYGCAIEVRCVCVCVKKEDVLFFFSVGRINKCYLAVFVLCHRSSA